MKALSESGCCITFPPPLSYSNYSKEAFEDWARHDDAQDHFCELDGKAHSSSTSMLILDSAYLFHSYGIEAGVFLLTLVLEWGVTKAVGFLPATLEL